MLDNLAQNCCFEENKLTLHFFRYEVGHSRHWYFV
jgi:hypothetical protein